MINRGLSPSLHRSALRCFGRCVLGRGYHSLAPALAFPYPTQENDRAQDRGTNQRPQDRLIVLVEKAKDLSAVKGTQVCQREVTNAARHTDCDQEPLARILHDAGNQRERRKGKRRRQQGGNKNAPETITIEYPANLLSFLPRQSFFQGFLFAFFTQSVSQVSAQGSARSCHGCVVRPPLFLMGRQDDGEGIHTAWNRERGIIHNAEQDQSQAAQPFQPSP